MVSAQRDSANSDPPIRLGGENAYGPWIRPICAIAVSSFLFVFVGTVIAAAWLAVMLLLELMARRLLPGSAAGVSPYPQLALVNTLAISLWWVVHAVLLWRTGGELLHIATIMDLFTVALYGAIGTFGDRKMLLALILPPLVTLAVLLIQYLYQIGQPLIALFASVATLGSCATILLNGLTMHSVSARMTAANQALAALARELEVNQWFLEEVSDLSRIGGWRIDAEKRMVAWSRWTRSIFEIDEAAAPGLEQFLNFLALDDRDAVIVAIDTALATGRGWDMEATAFTTTGRQIRVRLLGKMASAAGAPIGIVGTIHDITAQVETERTLTDLAAAARAANLAKDEFLANMSHEIRTPLNGILGLAAMLGKAQLSPDLHEMVGLIQSSGASLDRLLSDLLDISKIEAGKLDIVSQTFDLRDSIESAAYLMQSRALEKGLAFSIDYAPAAAGLFIGDAVRLRQIVSNLTANAVKFTPSGAVRILVDIEETTPQATLRLQVQDSGIGFDEATAEKLFNRFEQADGTITRKFGGTGLGLSISRRLAEAMGGSLDAASAPDRGSIFTLCLPLPRAADRHAVARTPPVDDSLPVPSQRAVRETPIRVLLAEDNPINQRYFRIALEPADFAVTIVGNGQEAVDAYLADRFDAVLLDMQMPVMDGLVATRAIRGIERKAGRDRTPIGMLTANAMKQHNEMARAAGCDFFITKPVLPDQLIDAICDAVV